MENKLAQGQTLTQTQKQALAPQQLLLVKLLELPVTDLESRVRNELEENSALEEVSDNNDKQPDDEFNASDEETSASEDDHYDTPDQYENDQRADYASEDDTPSYLLKGTDDNPEQRSFQISSAESFYDKLVAQLGEYELTEKQHAITEYLIGSLDSDGLLRKDLNVIRDELAIYHNIDATEKEIKDCLQTLQTFEPCGIAATSLQECLLFQLKNPDYKSDLKKLEIDILEHSFDDFTHKRIERLRERYHLTTNTVKDLYRELVHLNPRPGSALSDNTGQNQQQIIPDFIVMRNDNGEFDTYLNSGDVPQLRISRSYRDLIDEYSNNKKNMSRDQKNEYIYTKQKVDSARNFINAIQQRQNTLLSTMRAIVAMQKPFFEEGDKTQLQPMILKDIAAKTGLDVSTISRVSNSKYVQMDYGVFPLKFFFNDTFVTKDGEELSKVKIKDKLKELIDAEDKNSPLSDDVLSKLLKKEGYDVARRTVAKYREMMGLPVARLRK